MPIENGTQIEGRSWKRDLVIVAVATIVGTVALVLVDAFEYLHAVSRAGEHWNLDELFLGTGVLALSSVWFGWRRWQEGRRHLKGRVEADRRLRESRDELSFLISAAPGVIYTCEPQGEFGATFVAAGSIPGETETLPIAIYRSLSIGDDSRAVTLAGISAILAFVALWISHRFFMQRKK